MWRREQNNQAALPLGLALAGLALAAAALPGERVPAGTPAAIDLETTAKKGKRGPRGPVGPAGPRGTRGKRGPTGEEGPRGDRGSAGASAAPTVRRQFISIAWGNNRYAGRDRQGFVAPGIGEGHVRCTPPNPAQPDGVQWVRFMPYDNGEDATEENPEGVPPESWATTMWTERVGGNADDANAPTTNVTRTARLDRGNQSSGFHESMNTASVGHTPESTGRFTGIITTEPFDDSVAGPPPTTFELSWHWNFRDESANRCYVSATFVTEL